MEAASFAEIQAEFMERIQKAVYCSVATVDRQGRPRSRIMHVVWDGAVGWVITRPDSHKAKHLERNPFVSLAYIQDSRKPVYVDAAAGWVAEEGEKERIWKLHQTIPPPLGFDPQPHYGSTAHPFYGLLRFDPWRIELGNLGGEAVIWRGRE
jgi:general stress protein 26